MSDRRMGLVPLWLPVVSAAAPCTAQVTLVADGRPAATVVIAADAGEKVRHAATELRDYVDRMSGARLPLATDADEVTGASVLVGPSALTEAMDLAIPSGLTNARPEEGFIFECRPGRLVLAGGEQIGGDRARSKDACAAAFCSRA